MGDAEVGEEMVDTSTQMTAIFLRTFLNDLEWSKYALRSIQKFVTGIDEIIISVPHEDYEAFRALDLTREKLVTSKVATRAMDPYCGQQLDKLIADDYTNAQMIIYWDSDVIATRPFSPLDLMIDGKPRCLMTPYAKLLKADGSSEVPWQPIVEKALGHPVEHEWMREHPLIAPREALIGLRTYIANLHKCSLKQYVAQQPCRAFSEFNVLYGWAYHHRPDIFSWLDTEKPGVPKPFVRQFWSYSGLTDAERAEMERALA